MSSLTALLLGLALPAVASVADARKFTVCSAHKNKGETAAIQEFARKSGIKVEVVSDKAGELIDRLEAEKDAPVASLFIGVDGSVPDGTRGKGLFRPLTAPACWAPCPPACATGRTCGWA